jgi:hypothetical protein
VSGRLILCCCVALGVALLAFACAAATARADRLPLAYPHGDASPAVLLAGNDQPSNYGYYLGAHLAVSGDTAIVGETGAGVAYIYVREGHGWAKRATLTDASDPHRPGIGFGSAVAVSGDTAVVTDGQGAATDLQGMDPQAVYVYTRAGTTWALQAKLQPSGGKASDLTSFGESLAVSGDTIAVGAGWAQWGPNSGGQFSNGAGKVFVFNRTGDTWTQQAVLKPTAAVGTLFGESVAQQGDTLLVGAPFDETGGPFCGSVYAFQRSGATWTRSAILAPADATYGTFFGSAVALSDGTAVVGAPGWSYLGAAYVYTLADGQWLGQAELTAPDGPPNAEFGQAVAIDGDVIAVGSPRDDFGTNLAPYGSSPVAGSAQLYRRAGSSWEYETKLLGTTQQLGWMFGAAVGVTGSTALVGAPFEIVPAYQTENTDFDHVRVFCPYVADAGSTLSVSAADGLLANFAVTSNDDLTATLDGQPSNGAATVDADGSFTYTPNPGFTGTDTFTYQTVLGDQLSDPATVTVTVRDPVTPQTDVYGAPAGWTNHAVNVVLSSPVQQGTRRSVQADASPDTVYRKATKTATWTPYTAAIHVSTPGISIYDYRTSDASGNSSGARCFVVKIDTSRPTTLVPHAASCRRGSRVVVGYRIADAKPSCGHARATLVVRNAAGKVVRKFSLGLRATNKAQSFGWRCNMARGTYRVTVAATDVAGNRQSRASGNKLVVR